MRRNHNRRFLMLAFCLILLFISVGMTRGERGQIIGPESWVKTGVAWMQEFFYPPVQQVLADGKSLSPSQEHQLEAEIRQLKKENEKLKSLLGYKNKHPMTYISARVVYRSPDRFYHRVVINRGAKDGVRPKMPIITEEGLIGRVESVTSHMADIQLLTHSGAGPGISAVVQGENEDTLGIIEGYDPLKRCLVMKKIPVNSPVKKGQSVVTSDLSEIYPGGIYIGKVLEVKPGENGIEQIVSIQPGASFEQLDMVFVVRDPDKLNLQKHMMDTAEEKGENEDE